jgi:cation:H+ antiporter
VFQNRTRMIEIVIWVLIFTGSFLLIYFSADFFIDNLKELGVKHNFSPFILGLLILGIDPEESIASIVASINRLPYIALGNVIGNSILSLTICFALPAFFHKINLKSVKNSYFVIIFMSLLSILFAIFLGNLLIIFGLISIFLYLIYIIISSKGILNEKEGKIIENKDQLKEGERQKNTLQLVIYVFLSLVLIITGGEFLILSAENLITITGISETFFGFVIISFLTNVEELTLVFKSIKKNSLEIGLGGMIGKIIWNLCFTFGISAIILVQYSTNLLLFYNWALLAGLILGYKILTKRKYMYRVSASILLIFLAVFLFINFLNI